MRSIKTIITLMIGAFFMTSVVIADGIPKDWQLWYQDAASPVMERVNDMHIMLMWIITPILLFVTVMLMITFYRFREKKNPTPSKTTHNVPLEIIWTLIPVIIVAAIAFPSIKLIYFMDKTEKADMTVKVIGHQWYWEYEYPDHDISFDSFMLNRDQLKEGQIRNLDVDKQVVLPVETNVRILATSVDVLHSWAVPSFGIKQDTVPGRIRETWVRINKPGIYYGQCSELCGKDHGFMSIAVRAVSQEDFDAWVKAEGGKLPHLGKDDEPCPSCEGDVHSTQQDTLVPIKSAETTVPPLSTPVPPASIAVPIEGTDVLEDTKISTIDIEDVSNIDIELDN